jgi:hypothetical protein
MVSIKVLPDVFIVAKMSESETVSNKVLDVFFTNDSDNDIVSNNCLDILRQKISTITIDSENV